MKLTPLATLQIALAAGAAANFRPNTMGSTRPILDEYVALKSLIAARYDQVDVDLLEIGPGAASRQKMIIEQLRQSGAADDETVIRQARKLLATIAEYDPEALVAAESAQSPPDLS